MRKSHVAVLLALLLVVLLAVDVAEARRKAPKKSKAGGAKKPKVDPAANDPKEAPRVVDCAEVDKGSTYDAQDKLFKIKGKTTWKKIPSVEYDKESGNPYRVVRDAYGNIPKDSKLLVDVASVTTPPQKLHVVCAKRFFALAEAAAKAGMGRLAVLSGWRANEYNDNRDTYCKAMIKDYGSCAKGAEYKAFKSPHETGLAFDLGSPSPFTAEKTLIDKMKAHKLFPWLKANAHKHGITPYKKEPWHWECVIARESWTVGCEFTTDPDTRVEEHFDDDATALTTDVNKVEARLNGKPKEEKKDAGKKKDKGKGKKKGSLF
jgi:LAS superfamily LD-carboxypeptidase LdcB